MNCSAPGKILLSYSSTDEISNFFSMTINKRTENTITDFDSFILESERIKKFGYAIDNEEFTKGIICIAVPIFDYAENVVASIGISALTLYDDIDSLISSKFALLKKLPMKYLCVWVIKKYHAGNQ